MADAVLWKAVLPDRVKRQCGLLYATSKEVTEVAPAIEKAIALKKPVLIECIIPEDDKVFPMVPAGAPIDEVFDGDDLAEKAE